MKRTSIQKDDSNWKKVNIYRVGSKKYYRDSLEIIFALTVNYDGFDTVKGLKSLIDDIQETASNTLKRKKLYLRLK